jgi:hypothetical protein
VQGGGEPSFGREELGVLVQPQCERRGRLVGGGQLRGRVGAAVHPALEYGFDQVRALREVPVERADADPGQVGDFLGGCVHA